MLEIRALRSTGSGNSSTGTKPSDISASVTWLNEETGGTGYFTGTDAG